MHFVRGTFPILNLFSDACTRALVFRDRKKNPFVAYPFVQPLYVAFLMLSLVVDHMKLRWESLVVQRVPISNCDRLVGWKLLPVQLIQDSDTFEITY